MTLSTRSNPKLAQSGVALTSLGAVGGARGVSAGGLRILVEFLTTYDRGAMKELEADLAKADRDSTRFANNDAARARKLNNVRTQIAHVEANIRNRADADVRKQIRLQDSLQGVRTKVGKQQLAESKERLTTLLEAQGFTKQEIAAINNRYVLRKKETALVKQTDAAENRAQARAKQRVQTESQLTKIQAVRANLAPRLAGLAIGALGGIFGGAVLGVGFQLADQAIQKVGDALQDLIDPARHAREEVKDLAKAVQDIASQQNLTTLEAAKKFVQQAGIGSGPEADRLALLVKEVTVRQQVVDAIQQQLQLQDIKRNNDKLDAEALKQAIDLTRKNAKEQGTYRTTTEQAVVTSQLYGATVRSVSSVTHEFVGDLTLEEAAKRTLSVITGQLTDQQYDLAQATARAAQNASNASALWNVYASSLAGAINAAVELQTAPIDKQISALGDATSAKTKALQAAIERAGGGGGGGGPNTDELRNIAEEKALILLRMRLKLMGENINLEKYSGKFLMEAINAKIAALQKEGAAQSRMNQLLDLQYKMSQQTERQTGESISAFIQRRAQEQRALLSEQADLAREAQISQLEDRKDNLQDQLDLEALAERKRAALRASGTSNHLANLQKQLQASQEADKKAYEAKKAALEKQKKALEAAAAEAVALTSETGQRETLAAIAGMKNLEDVGMFSGRMAGLLRAKSAIQALVEGFGLPAAIAKPFLTKLNALINAAGTQQERVYRNVVSRTGNVAFAEGGVFAINNANHPFGSNIKAGEEGTELGIVLSHNVAKILQAQKPQVSQIGPITINRSDDPFRDSYQLRRVVRAEIEAAFK